MKSNTFPETIVDARRAIEEGSITVLEMVQTCIDRISEKETVLNAFITKDVEHALYLARKIDQQVKSTGDVGGLLGITIAHKDVFLTSRLPTTAASQSMLDHCTGTDAKIVTQFEDVGAICLGKTNLHEFAFGSPTEGDYFSAARNPWNSNHMPGSSSSGSAVAVAAGFCFVATGSDTGGSVRHPAAACGLVGMKPTQEVLSKNGVIPLAPSMDQVGIITRSTQDGAYVLAALTGEKEPLFNPDLISLKGVRIGVDFQLLEIEGIHPCVREHFDQAIRTFKELGARIISVQSPDLKTVTSTASNIINFEAYQELYPLLDAFPEKLGQGLIRKLEIARETTLSMYLKAMETRIQLRKEVNQLFHSPQEEGIHILLSVGRESPAESLSDLMQKPTGARSSCNRLYSLTGHPAITLPMGFSESGLPLALQLSSSYFNEMEMFRIAFCYESVTQWVWKNPQRPWID